MGLLPPPTLAEFEVAAVELAIRQPRMFTVAQLCLRLPDRNLG